MVDEGSALSVDPFAIEGIESPGAVESEAAGWGDARFGNGYGVESFNGVQTDVGQGGRRGRDGHGEILAEDVAKGAESGSSFDLTCACLLNGPAGRVPLVATRG